LKMPEVQGLDLPAAIAKNAAAKGVAPPKVDLPLPDWTNPYGVGSALTGQSVGGESVPLPRPRPGMEVGAQSRGGAGGPAGAPMDIRSEAQKAGEAGAQGTKKSADLAELLRGVKMPAGPPLPKTMPPAAAPRPSTQIRGGDLAALLQSLFGGSGGGGGGGQGGPMTLGKAIGR